LNGDTNQVLHPEIDGSLPGETILCGPNHPDDGVREWAVGGFAGAVVEVILSLNATDMRHKVLCRAAE